MKNGSLHSFREKVKNTETFKSWPPIVQKISMTRNNLAHVNHGFTVASNIGYKKWESQSCFNYRNKKLIEELLKNDK